MTLIGKSVTRVDALAKVTRLRGQLADDATGKVTKYLLVERFSKE